MAIIAQKIRHLFLLLLIFFCYSCSTESDVGDVTVETNNIPNFIEDDENFSTLNLALNRTGFKEILKNENYTFLAPNDVAFNSFLLNSEYESINTVPVDILKQLLENHLIEENFKVAELSTGYYNSKAKNTEGKNFSLYINASEVIKINGTAEITRSNISLENGMIHEINAVLEIPTITTFLEADENLGLAKTSFDDNPTYNYQEAFASADSPAPFTVLMPQNSCYGDFETEFSFESIEEISPSFLSAILSYHVVAQQNISSEDFINYPVLQSMHGANWSINVEDGSKIMDSNGRTANVITSNIQGKNGVIHIVDKLLLPMVVD